MAGDDSKGDWGGVNFWWVEQEEKGEKRAGRFGEGDGIGRRVAGWFERLDEEGKTPGEVWPQSVL